MVKVERSKKERKSEYFDKFVTAITSFKNILLVNVDNVTSNQLAQVRKSLRGRAEILMGKNTLIRKILNSITEQLPETQKLIQYVRGNIGFVFTNESLSSIKNILIENESPAPAKTGSIAPSDVVIPAGPTNMPPEKTSFFQALNIATKINRGLVEIISNVHLIKKGDKIDASQAELLSKMNINPFSYKVNVVHVYEDGQIYPCSVLDITESDLMQKFLNGVSNIASISLAIDYPTVASVPHSIMNGFKNIISVALVSDISFEAVDKVKDMINNPLAYISSNCTASSTTDPSTQKDVAEPEKEESEVDFNEGVGLFGNDEEEW